MAAFYLDSSALVKRYIAETGTIWMVQLTEPAAGHDLYTAALAGPEVIAAITRRVRGGHITPVHGARALASARVDWSNRYISLNVDDPTVRRAMDLAEVHGLRGSDAIHLAAAVLLHQQRQAMGLAPLTFVSADQEQLRAAAIEGLAVEDPNLHL